jgi:hypothetical protein
MILLSYVLRSILHPTFLFWLCCFIPNEIPTANMTRPCEATGGGSRAPRGRTSQGLRWSSPALSLFRKNTLWQIAIFIGKSLQIAIFNSCVELPEGTWYNSGHARRDDTGMMRIAGNHPRPYEKNYFQVSELL